MTTRRHHSLFVAILLAAGLLGACATFGGTTSIAEVQSNPGHYVDRTVNVTGVVTSSWGIPLVPYRIYRVSDGGAEIMVLSDGRRTPTYHGAGCTVRLARLAMCWRDTSSTSPSSE